MQTVFSAWTHSFLRSPASLLLIAILSTTVFATELPEGETMAYDSNPEYLWNRLNETLFLRTSKDGKKYGPDDLDILFWNSTKHLLVGPSHQQALRVLDEFVTRHGENLIRDPLPRALLQRDLWKLFDWSAQNSRYSGNIAARLELQTRLATIIRRIALTTNEIAALPDNYAQSEKSLLVANLPHDLFQTNGPWINLAVRDSDLAAKTHVNSFGGRSVFLVLFHDPEGRKAGTNYLARLCSFHPMWLAGTNSDSLPHEPELNPALPQFPTNTQWALVRRMCVIDTQGQIQPTHLVESIQMRTYLAFPDRRHFVSFQALAEAQRFEEFRMSRGAGLPLVAVLKNQMDFSHFMSKGWDPFEIDRLQRQRDPELFKGEILRSCESCHLSAGPGIFTVNLFTRFFSADPTFRTTQLVEQNPEREAEATIYWKYRQFDWGLFQGISSKSDQTPFHAGTSQDYEKGR